MIAVITGDIIGSELTPTETWLHPLKDLFSLWGTDPKDWEIYRGDEFQLKSPVQEVFHRFLAIKSLVKSLDNLDVRIAIGVGSEEFSSHKITESNGPAFVNSGRLLNQLKSEGRTLAYKGENQQTNEEINLLLKWVSLEFDSWTGALAQIIHQSVMNPDLTQEELAQRLNITQSSVSQRVRRANWDLVLETERYFRNKSLKQ